MTWIVLPSLECFLDLQSQKGRSVIQLHLFEAEQIYFLEVEMTETELGSTLTFRVPVWCVSPHVNSIFDQ